MRHIETIPHNFTESVELFPWEVNLILRGMENVLPVAIGQTLFSSHLLSHQQEMSQ